MVLFTSVLVVMSIVTHGYTNWLQGSMLMTAYFIIALIYWHNPLGMAAILQHP